MPPALRPSRRRKAKRAARFWSMVVLQIMCGDTKGFVTGRLSQGHGLQSQWAVKGGSRGRRGVTTVVDGGAHQERFLQRFAAEAKFCRVERVSAYEELEVAVDRPRPYPVLSPACKTASPFRKLVRGRTTYREDVQCSQVLTTKDLIRTARHVAETLFKTLPLVTHSVPASSYFFHPLA